MKLGIISGMLACLSTVLAPHAAAREPQPSAQALMQEMAGVYKHRFVSGMIVPGKDDATYTAEDVVEVVPFDKEHVYVRARLNFYNGHQCGIAAMARYEDGAFVYRDQEAPPPGLAQCVMKAGIDKGKLTITDRLTPEGERSCDKYCGARGRLNYAIGMERRRPIRYMERLKASRQYQAAIEEMRAAGR